MDNTSNINIFFNHVYALQNGGLTRDSTGGLKLDVFKVEFTSLTLGGSGVIVDASCNRR